MLKLKAFYYVVFAGEGTDRVFLGTCGRREVVPEGYGPTIRGFIHAHGHRGSSIQMVARAARLLGHDPLIKIYSQDKR